MLNNSNTNSLSDAQLLPKARPELMVYPQVYDGQPYWIYKDPLSLRYYRFNREEHYLIEQLSNNITLGELIERHQKHFNTETIKSGEIAEFIRSLMQKNILIVNHPERDQIFFDSAKKTRNKKFFGQLMNFMFLKIPIYDPDKHFNKAIDKLRFIWTPGFFVFYVLLLLTSGVLIIDRWHDFVSMFQSNFFTVWNLPLLFAAIWITKVIHEFGHGFTCKHYGGEVHEIGFLFLVFMPMLYCNITDSWIFPNKMHRVVATAAGILTELMIAACAAIIWYFTEQPGFVHAFCFNVLIACSISTIMFNANPLMKFDGYYIVMDLMEIPNLRKRASDAINNVWIKYIFGGKPMEAPEEHKYKFIFPFYAVFAFLYRIVLVFSITFMIYKFFESMKLASLGKLIMFSSIFSMCLFPLYKGGAMILTRRDALGITNNRLLIILAIVVVTLGLTMTIPLQQNVTLNFILEPAQMQWVRSEVPGKLTISEKVRQGQWLKAGEIVAQIENPLLASEILILKSQLEQAKIERSMALNNSAAETVARIDSRIDSLSEEIRLISQQLEKQTITTPFDAQTLTLDSDLDVVKNSYITQGSAIMLIADTRIMQAKVLVPEKILSRITTLKDGNQPEAELMLYGFSNQTFTGKVVNVASHCEYDMGIFGERLALSNKVGGEVLTEYDAATKKEKPVEAVYEVTINLELDKLDPSALAYMSGRARIDCGHSTIYSWCKDSLLRFISLDIWL